MFVFFALYLRDLDLLVECIEYFVSLNTNNTPYFSFRHVKKGSSNIYVKRLIFANQLVISACNSKTCC